MITAILPQDLLFDNLVPPEDEDNNDVILEVRAGLS